MALHGTLCLHLDVLQECSGASHSPRWFAGARVLLFLRFVSLNRIESFVLCSCLFLVCFVHSLLLARRAHYSSHVVRSRTHARKPPTSPLISPRAHPPPTLPGTGPCVRRASRRFRRMLPWTPRTPRRLPGALSAKVCDLKYFCGKPLHFARFVLTIWHAPPNSPWLRDLPFCRSLGRRLRHRMLKGAHLRLLSRAVAPCEVLLRCAIAT